MIGYNKNKNLKDLQVKLKIEKENKDQQKYIDKIKTVKPKILILIAFTVHILATA